MKVLRVNPIGLLLSIFGWAFIATLVLYYRACTGNVVRDLSVSSLGWSSPFLDGCYFGVCMEDKNVNLAWPVAKSMSSEGMRTDPILEPKHKIFLSHSGAQKEFVDHLCKALEDRFHYPFFDRRHESLPKGEQFPELIVQAAKQCELLIVVVSEEYFMSKWPMIELSAFVKAHNLHHKSKSSTNGPKILPLFYGLSVNDLADATMQSKWFQKWEILAEADIGKRIIVDDWKYALSVLKSFNGLPYDKNLKEIVAYQEKIVSYVCKSIPPDIKWDDSHVKGKSSILKVIDEKIEGVEVSRRYKVKVVGIYGVGGTGKTTTCKTLCNELSSKYEGRVCHIEFPIVPLSDSKVVFQKVLRELTRKSMDVIQHLDEGQETFLAINNILDNYKSIQLAKTLLELPYHPDSLVVVTARSQSVLELLGLDGDASLEMPDLGEADAVKLFLQHAAGGKEFFESQEKHDIMTCVRRCYFSKGDTKGHHYHPLALQALGLQLHFLGENPSDWVKNLPRVRTFNYFSGGNPVFDILRSSFDSLLLGDQTLFMDVGRFSYFYDHSTDFVIEWLCIAHKQDKEEIFCRLEHLKWKGLLLDVDLRSGRISMHDLYREFAHLEAKGSLNELPKLGERKWVYVDNCDLTELERKPWSGYAHKIIRLTIADFYCRPEKHGRINCGIGCLKGINWDYFSHLEVLQLSGLDWGHRALNLEGLMSLRILEVIDVREVDAIEGLEELNHFTYFTWKTSLLGFRDGMNPHIVGQLPSSLKQLSIFGTMVLGSDLLGQCHDLSKLMLHSVEARSLDLSNCSSLESVYLSRIQKLQTLSGPAARWSSKLQSLQVLDCRDLVDVSGIDHHIGLKELKIEYCIKCKGMNLKGFNQLEFLSLRWCLGLTSLVGLGDLPALQVLNLRYCRNLMRLPDLSTSRNLRGLDLRECSALELFERDIQMLSELPLLHPVPFSLTHEPRQCLLDLAQRKVLVYQQYWKDRQGWQRGQLESGALGS